MLEMFNILDASCGSINIPDEIVSVIRSVVMLIQIAVPIILIVMGMLDLGKAVTSQKEDEIKKAQSMLIKRLIYGVLVFLVIAIVRFILGLIGGSSDALDCLGAIFGY